MNKNSKKDLTPKKSFRDISPEAKKRAALLVFNTLILTFIYFGSTQRKMETKSLLTYRREALTQTQPMPWLYEQNPTR